MQQSYFKRYFLVIVLIMLTMAGCRTTKKVSGVSGNSNPPDLHWSSGKVKKAINAHYIQYRTLSARVHIDFENEKEQYNNITAYLRMKKDSIIWLSVRPVLGIEMARLVITADSVKLLNNLKKTVFIRSSKDVEQVLHIPFEFSVMESLLLGNPMYIPEKIKHFRADTSGISVTLFMDSIICKYHWSVDPFLLKKSHFQISSSPASADQLFSAYQEFPVGQFSLKRDIKMQLPSNTRIRLTFDKIKFDVPVQFPFHYNENYEER